MSTFYNSFEYDILIKTVVIGNHGVGKSSLLRRYSDDVFEHGTKATIGVDCAWRTIEKDGHVVKMQMWDTSGSERFRAITASYYRGSHCALLVYDVTDRHSFECIPGTWLRDLTKNGTCDSAVLMLVANKCDSEGERVVSTEEGRALAERHGIGYVETSALSSDGVQEAFHSALEAVIPMRLQDIAAKKARADSGKDMLFLSNRPVQSMTCMQRMASWLGWSR